MRLMSMHGRLPAHIRCRSSIQFRHSRRMWRTVWRPWPHWHSSVSALLIVWRYARRPIFPVRICVIAELIALCVLACRVSMSFPGRTPRLKSSLPCLALSQDSSHSLFIVRRMVDFVVAISVWSDSGCGGGPSTVRVSGSYPAAILAVRSAASLPGTPACAGIHRNCTSHPCLRSSSSACTASTRIYWPEGCSGLRIAWMAAWLSVKMVHLPGVGAVACISSTIRNANTNPLSSAAYAGRAHVLSPFRVYVVNPELGCYRSRPNVPVNAAPVGVDADRAWFRGVVFFNCVIC